MHEAVQHFMHATLAIYRMWLFEKVCFIMLKYKCNKSIRARLDAEEIFCRMIYLEVDKDAASQLI